MVMTTRSELVGLNELYGYLLSHESCNEKKNKTVQFSSSANQASCGGSSGCAHRGENFEWFVAMVMVEAATTTCHTVKSARE
jgi:hypothetical protein